MKRGVVVGALGSAQTLAWGSSYYLPAILADPIATGLGLSRTVVFGLFSGALLLSAVLGPAVGRAIDNRGGRGGWPSPICRRDNPGYSSGASIYPAVENMLLA